jgi:hypothetical protein
MKSLKRPDKIEDLKLWFDASDESTINNGRVSDSDLVFNFRDKVTGIQVVNILPGQGPTYSFGMVNGKHAISMNPQYSLGADGCVNALGTSSISTLNSATCSMFCVYKPTGIYLSDASGNQKYVVNILDFDNSITAILPGNLGNKSIYLGDETSPNASISQRANPSGRYVEADTSSGLPYTNTTTYNEHIPSRNEWQGASTSLNKVCMTIVRTQRDLKKIGFLTEDNSFVDDFVANTVATDRPIKLTGQVYSPGPSASLVFGAYRPSSYTVQSNFYPFQGYFCEFIYFDRYLTDDEANTVKEYLKMKWFT